MISKMTSSENLSKFGRTLSSPIRTSVAGTTHLSELLIDLFSYKHWAEAGIQNIKDLINCDFMVMTYRYFLERNIAYMPLSLNFMEDLSRKERDEVFGIEDVRWKRSGVFGAKTYYNNQADKISVGNSYREKFYQPPKESRKMVKGTVALKWERIWTGGRQSYLLLRLCTLCTKIRN